MQNNSLTMVNSRRPPDIERENPYTGKIDGVTPGQPYAKQWWMHYFEIKAPGGRIQFKRNRFTRTLYAFTIPDEGNRWNEPGYGWGTWIKV